jgi:uracil-DNA glycosylase family 4
MGSGNIDADIVFIGEAPGKKEDEIGEPFIGAAGKFLNEMLATAGMTRSDVYITNIVKYRPPENRDPSPAEKKAFWPYLMRQLHAIRPQIVVTLGRHSMEYFLPDIKISEIHGQPQNILFRSLSQVSQDNSSDAMQGNGEQQTEVRERRSEGVAEPLTQQRAETVMASGGFADDGYDWTVALVPLYHPAAALYNGGLRTTLIEDFMKLPTIINSLTKENK